MLRAWLQSRFGDQVDVDDVVQEAYLRVLKARESAVFSAPKAYFFAIARNIALQSLRAKSVRGENHLVQFDDCDILDDVRDVAESAAQNEELELLTQAIQSLPERCCQIFTLRKVYGMPQREIAAQLGISARTVNAQLSIAFNKCAKVLKRYRRELQR